MSTNKVNFQAIPAYLTGFRSTLQAGLPQAPSMDTIAPAQGESFIFSGAGMTGPGNRGSWSS